MIFYKLCSTFLKIHFYLCRQLHCSMSKSYMLQQWFVLWRCLLWALVWMSVGLHGGTLRNLYVTYEDTEYCILHRMIMYIWGNSVADMYASGTACYSNPCFNAYGCYEILGGGFYCECDYAYTGITCDIEIDECMLPYYQCYNGGTCIDYVGYATCQCPSGFYGYDCSLSKKLYFPKVKSYDL